LEKTQSAVVGYAGPAPVDRRSRSTRIRSLPFEILGVVRPLA